MKEIISFPHLGYYHVPISFLLRKATKKEVLTPPNITKKTLELGSKYAPTSVCIPFKYNLGNYIEALEQGATILFQAGGGCRYGNYSEVQEKILRDLGYNFKFYTLSNKGSYNIFYMYKVFKKINKKLGFFKYLYYLLLTVLMIIYMDLLDSTIRRNIGFEVESGKHTKVRNQMLRELANTKGFIHLTRIYFKYKKKLKNIQVNKPEKTLKIGIIGELYTAMEPFSTFFLENELAKENIEIKRFTNLSYLLFFKKLNERRVLNKIRKYCSFKMGADASDNIYRTLYLIEHGYDGIIHTKPFGCTPEVMASPIIDKIAHEYEMPLLFLTFDSSTSEVGIKTRLEAFYDMLRRY